MKEGRLCFFSELYPMVVLLFVLRNYTVRPWIRFCVCSLLAHAVLLLFLISVYRYQDQCCDQIMAYLLRRDIVEPAYHSWEGRSQLGTFPIGNVTSLSCVALSEYSSIPMLRVPCYFRSRLPAPVLPVPLTRPAACSKHLLAIQHTFITIRSCLWTSS